MVWVFPTTLLWSQNTSSIKGVIKAISSEQGIANAELFLEGGAVLGISNTSGEFSVEVSLIGEFILQIVAPEYSAKRIPIILEGNVLDLGTIYLEPDIMFEKSINLVNLTEDELLDDEVNSNALALLQSTRDIFLNRAAFDFGQAF